MPGGVQGCERVERPVAAQFRVATAQDQLLGLDEELDLPDPAPAKLQIDPFGRDTLIDLVDVNLALDGVDVSNGRKVQVLAPDIGREFVQERLPRQHVAGTGPSLDVGGALPVLAHAFIILQGRGHRDGKGGR